jgi:hypothetical protein
MEAELVAELPTGDWQYEPKWDGFRGILENDGGELALWSRNERPLLRYFPELVPLGKLLPPHSALDGEIVISKKGKLDFDSMQLRLHPAESRIRKFGRDPAQFIVFDVLLWKGEKLHKLPLEKRRKELERKAKRFQLSPYTRDPRRRSAGSTASRRPGSTGRREDARIALQAGSREAVAKVKKYKTADCVIVGFRYSEKAEGRISTLLLGLYDKDGDLDFVGHCSGITASLRKQIEAELPKLEHARLVSDKRIPVARAAGRRAASSTGTRCGPSSCARCATTSSSATASGTGRASCASVGQGSEGLHVARGQAAAPTGRPDGRITSWRGVEPPAGGPARLPATRVAFPSLATPPPRPLSSLVGSAGSRSSFAKSGIRLRLWRHMPLVRSPTSSMPLAHRGQRERAPPYRPDLVPVERRRGPRVRDRPDRVCRRDRPVARVLAVVDEDSRPVGHLPRRRRHALVTDPPLDLLRHRLRQTAPHLGKRRAPA